MPLPVLLVVVKVDSFDVFVVVSPDVYQRVLVLHRSHFAINKERHSQSME